MQSGFSNSLLYITHYEKTIKILLSKTLRSRSLVLILIHRTNRAETAAVALARVSRFEFRLLSGRNEMRVLFQILDDLFGNHFPLKAAQRVFD